MVWCGARNGRSGASAPVPDPGRAVDLRDLERLLEAGRRQDPGQATGEHRLAGARRADHEQVVAARRGDLERPLGVLLAADVGEVGPLGARAGGVRRRRLRRIGRPATVQEVGEPRQRGDAGDLDPLDQCRLGSVRLGDQEPGVARPAGAQRGVQRSPDRPQLSAQGQLAGERVALERLGGHLAAGGEQPDRDREIEARARPFARARARG